MKRAQQCCGNCDAFIESAPPEGPAIGACVANPPLLIQGMAPVPGSQLSPQGPRAMPVYQGVWPPTQRTRWCRAWKPKEEILQ